MTTIDNAASGKGTYFLIFAICMMLGGLSHHVFAEDKVGFHSGDARVELKYINAVQRNGSPSPTHDKECDAQLSNTTSKFKGMSIFTRYAINSQSLVMSATSYVPSPNALTPLLLTIDLHPLGLSNRYAFGAFRPPELPYTYVMFSLDKKFENPASTFLIINDEKNYLLQ